MRFAEGLGVSCAGGARPPTEMMVTFIDAVVSKNTNELKTHAPGRSDSSVGVGFRVLTKLVGRPSRESRGGRLFLEEADVDVEHGQDGDGYEADVAVEGIDLKSQEQGEREREIETDDSRSVSEDLQIAASLSRDVPAGAEPERPIM